MMKTCCKGYFDIKKKKNLYCFVNITSYYCLVIG